jgi:hypothetical protein
MHTLGLILNKHGSIERSYYFRVLILLKLHDPIYPFALTNSNCFIERGLLQLSNMLPVNPLRFCYYWVSGEDHTSIIIKLKHSAKPMIIRIALWLTPRINPPLLFGSLSHTLSLVVYSSNIVGYLGSMHLKHTIVNALCWLTSLRWVVNWRCLLLNLPLII